MHPVAAVLVTLAAQARPESGPALFQAWCKSCHGHVATSLVAALPTVGPEPRRPSLISFLL